MSDGRALAALAIARGLASEHSQAKLPCPLCAAGVRGDNLEKHLAKVHGGGTEPPGSIEPLGWSGPSRRVPVLGFAALLVAAVWVAATRSGVVAVTPRIEAGIVTVFVLVFSVVLLLAETNRLRARLTFAEGTFVLFLPLALRPRRLTLPAEVEIGAITERRSTAMRVGDDYVWSDDGERRLGSYLRLHHGSASIIVLAAGTSIREFWKPSGGQNGPKRARYDIRLDAADFVALAYLLASHGLLALKPV